MKITKEQVKHVAKLSKLSFTSDELSSFTHQLDKIMDMVELLEEVDTTGVPFTSNINQTTNVMREDRAIEGANREELLKNVPLSDGSYIKVPAMLGNEEISN